MIQHVFEKRDLNEVSSGIDRMWIPSTPVDYSDLQSVDTATLLSMGVKPETMKVLQWGSTFGFKIRLNTNPNDWRFTLGMDKLDQRIIIRASSSALYLSLLTAGYMHVDYRYLNSLLKTLELYPVEQQNTQSYCWLGSSKNINALKEVIDHDGNFRGIHWTQESVTVVNLSIGDFMWSVYDSRKVHLRLEDYLSDLERQIRAALKQVSIGKYLMHEDVYGVFA